MSRLGRRTTIILAVIALLVLLSFLYGMYGSGTGSGGIEIGPIE